MIQQDIAQLTGRLKFVSDSRPLTGFMKKLETASQHLRNFGALAGKKYNVKVNLDSRSLRAQLEKVDNTNIVFKRFTVSEEALAAVKDKLKHRIGDTPIILKGIKVNLTDILEQRKMVRTALGKMSLELPVTVRMREADAKLRAWKKTTEEKYKLHVNADISQAKFLANVRKSLKAAGGKVGELKVDIANPKLRLHVDRENLREQVRRAIEGVVFRTKVKADTETRTRAPRASEARRERSAAVGGGVMGAGMGFMRGAIPGLGAAFAISQLNQINQQMQGQRLAMTAVMGDQAKGEEQTQWVRQLADQIGFDFREVGPSFNKMLASGKTSGMSTESVQNIFQGVTEYGRVMGLDSESMKGSMKAIEQMMNKGQVMSEELKGQLAERMPGAISAMAEAAGFGTDDAAVAKLMDAMQKGQVKSGAVMEKFARILADRARQGGALEKAMQATAAQQARFNNAFSKAVEVFSIAGFDKGMGQFFKSMAAGIETAEPMIEALGEAFYYLIEPVNATINVGAHLVSMLAYMGESVGLSKGQLVALATVAATLISPIGAVVTAVGALALAFDDLFSYFNGDESLLGEWLAQNQEAAEVMGDLRKEASAFAEVISNAFSSTVNLAAGLQGLSVPDMLLSTMKELDAMLKAFNELVDRFSAAKQYADISNVTNTPLEQNLRTMQAMTMGKDWALEQANQITVEQVQQRTVKGSSDVPGRQSLANMGEIEARVTAAIRATQPANAPDVKPLEVNITIPVEGMYGVGDLAMTLERPIKKAAEMAFTQMIENARARQKEQ